MSFMASAAAGLAVFAGAVRVDAETARLSHKRGQDQGRELNRIIRHKERKGHKDGQRLFH
jgi:hypothetical protein